MQPNPNFIGLGKDFWAHVRSLSQTVGYTKRSSSQGPGQIKVPTLQELMTGLASIGLSASHLVLDSKPTAYAQLLLDYFAYRAAVLNDTVEKNLMDAARAEQMFERLSSQLKPSLPFTMNKQSGEKKKISYLTAMVNMLIEANANGISFDHDPRELTTITRGGKPLRTLARRFDGAFPSAVNPIAVWEVKEYYYTTTFGSRVADGVYETLLDGMELEELREHENISVAHLLIVDAHYTWWTCGKAYLCRMIDMLHMGYVGEILFGAEIESRLPLIVQEWVKLYQARAQSPKLV